MAQKVVIIAVGDELLSGVRQDSNAFWLAAKFHNAGWSVEAIEEIPDVEERICDALARWTGKVDLLILSGGLGPTHDDRTRQAIARFLGCGLIRDDTAYDRILERYSNNPHMKAVLERSRQYQALVPEKARAVHNPSGSALGIAFEREGTRVFSFPGVPWEFRAMAEQELGPLFEEGSGKWSSVFIVGWPENDLKDRIASVLEAPDLHCSILPDAGLIQVVIRGEPERVLEGERTLRALLPEDCLPAGACSLQEAVISAAEEKRKTVSLAESCTGGLIGAALTEVPGSSKVFLGSAVTYSNASKERILGVDGRIFETDGAVSEACAKAMAEGSRRVYGSDFALSVTGIAGPDGGSPEKPVGIVWFCLVDDRGAAPFMRSFSGDRAQVRRWARTVGLETLWRALKRA